MASEVLLNELRSIKEELEKSNKKVTDENAFEYLAMQFFCYKIKNIKPKLYDIESSITNGPNDGGIDFVYYDDEESKVVLGQCKYTENMKLNDIISELNKMSSTVENFKKAYTGTYNKKLKTNLQNALDRLPDESAGNVEYCIFTTSDINQNDVTNKLHAENNLYSKDMVSVYGVSEINSQIKELIEKAKTVNEYKIEIDYPHNVLQYETDNVSGIMVNMSSESLVRMYDKFKDEGLFDLNIRKYIKNKTVDEGIKETLDKERDNFWFYNNGLTIACSEYVLDGNKVKLYDFSIVNGGQTTNRIGNYKGSNNDKFYLPCKIISIKNDDQKLYSKIAEATNSQKPINPRDLKSNSPEMKMLQRWLGKEGVYLEIKRGEKKKLKNIKSIKNDELGQLLLSFGYQQPGTARSGKRNIFENKPLYNKLYRVNYEKDPNKKEFVLDLIKLSEDYTIIEADLKNGTTISDDEKIVLSNAKYVIFSLLGLSYYIVNEDYSRDDLNNDISVLKSPDLVYSKFISNYKADDYQERLKSLIEMILDSLCDTYENCVARNEVTSISNLFKTDKKYRDSIVKDFLNVINKRTMKNEFISACEILKR
ncbi:AIPR family protein [Catenibacterium mitsuokai]|uniref:AIPR family protein n=1 Tax=Catenibacterium mitsuokai TaxID=100886 RepID=UPI00031DE2AE|nr:AIPR family protein [Catenibacterium mitsuokai]UWO52654.1 AIPR family protein [Catenibacterium mitsuokai]